MARQQQKDYKFTPGGAGVGTVKIPGNYEIADILTIINATDQTFIYNFADPDLGATVSFAKVLDADFPTAQDGVTTITLTVSTSSMNANDSLAIYIETEAQYIRPWPFGTDAVERMRTANPQSLIDADFEYGLQNTKWQSLSLNNDIPSIYEFPGSEMTLDVAGYATFIVSGTISSSGDTSIEIANQQGTTTPPWTADDYALVVNPYVANPPPTTHLTSTAPSSNQRTLTVANAAAFVSGDELVMVQLPSTNTTTMAGAITSGATTTFALTSTSGINIDDMLLVNTAEGSSIVWELVAVTGVSSPNVTVVRRRLNTNSGNVNINNGAGVRKVANVEIALVSTIDTITSLSVNRGWMNTTPVRDLTAGSIIQKLNKDPGTGSGANVEIVKLTTIGTAAGNAATIARGQLGTTAVTAAPEGSLLIRLCGIFQAGNAEVPVIAVDTDAHGISANAFVSTAQHNNSNTEGLYQVQQAETNYITYYPRKLTGLQLGYPLNKFDTQVRRAAAFTGATIVG